MGKSCSKCSKKKVGKVDGGYELSITGNSMADLILGGIAGGVLTDVVQKNVLDKVAFIRDTKLAPSLAKAGLSYFILSKSNSDFIDGVGVGMGAIGGSELLADAGITTGRLIQGSRKTRNKKPRIQLVGEHGTKSAAGSGKVNMAATSAV